MLGERYSPKWVRLLILYNKEYFIMFLPSIAFEPIEYNGIIKIWGGR